MPVVTKKPKKKGNVKVKVKSSVRKKGEQQNDSLKKAPTIVPSNGIVFKVKMKKKKT